MQRSGRGAVVPRHDRSSDRAQRNSHRDLDQDVAITSRGNTGWVCNSTPRAAAIAVGALRADIAIVVVVAIVAVVGGCSEQQQDEQQ